MKKITLITLMLFTALSYAQVGINTNTPDASSALEIESTTGGILIPRLTETQRDAIVSPASGLMIYQTDQDFGFYFYNGTQWTSVGMSGPQGPQGIQGESGPAGADSTVPGPQGPQGLAGADGAQGPIGLTGNTGPAGLTGPSGDDGADGAQGPTGNIGPQGIQGESGPAGADSTVPGPQGPQGLAGADGAQGPIGLTGNTGPAGLTGPSGANGIDGINGSDGVDGSQGPIGLTGNTGPTGLTGPSGDDGADGAQGPTGNIGPAGPPGAQGPSGDAGAQGPQGEPGTSIGGYKTINTIFNQNISVAPESIVNGSIPGVNTNYLIINFTPKYNSYHNIGLNISCYDSNNVLLDLYVEELIYRRDKYYSTRQDFTKIESNYFNTTQFDRSYVCVTGPNGNEGEAKGYIKIWSNGNIERIEYSINNDNINSNFSSTRTPTLKIFTFN